MAVAVVKSRALNGMHAPEVVVEAHLANGLPAFTLVGLPETEVKEARERQMQRQGKPNSALGTPEIEQFCRLDEAGEALLKQAIARLSLSARAYHRVLKLARSVAGLAGSDTICTAHLAEAIQYRRQVA